MSFADDGGPFEEYESNGNIFDDPIVIHDSSLEQVNVICDLQETEVNDTLKVIYPDIDHTFIDDTFIDDAFVERSDVLNPLYFNIYLAIQTTKPLYQGFVVELDSIREQLPSTTSILNETSPSTNVVTSPSSVTTTTVEAQRTSFSPFTPNTFDELISEIKRNSENIAQLESVTDPAVLDAVRETLLDEKRFFLLNKLTT